MQFYNQSFEEVLKYFGSDKENGLSESEANKRLQTSGLNELKLKRKINLLVIFFKQFKSFIIYILLFAVVISFLTKEYVDSTVILTILIFNAFFGFIQEYRAEKAIEELKKLAALKANVLRKGNVVEVDSKFIVPGDIILLEEGDKIPADARLIFTKNLETLESSLTGESNPVSKTENILNGKLTIADQKNMIFSGTLITKGRAKAVVVATGMKTEIGKIATLIEEVEKELTPLQKNLESFGKWIGLGVILISLLIFIIEIVEENLLSLLLSGEYASFIIGAKQWFLTAIALAVAAVPEGLPAIVTISLAIGVRKMLRRNVLIRRLPSIETLGETTVICSDKTGTLTKNEMTIKKVYTNSREFDVGGTGYSTTGNITYKGKPIGEKDLLVFRIGVLCNDASLDLKDKKIMIIGDPTETALLVSAEKAGIKHEEFRKSWARIDEEPFDSIRKMMSTINKSSENNKNYVFTKGAPEKVIERCDRIILNGKILKLNSKLKKEILEKNEEFAKSALRVLGFAFKEQRKEEKLEDKLIFVGLQGMIDPPRPEVKDSIKKCMQAGIRVIMVTGDNKHTAKAISEEIGITGEAIDGAEFSQLSKREKEKIINKVSIFARVEPIHKLEIIKLLQGKGFVTAMTGDGVNDAPALKKSDIGIAMGIKGTDVAKEASDMILQDDNFTSIVNSVEEGRGIYDNIKKFVNYLLSSNLAEVLIIFLAILFGWPLPMTAIMLLWINLVTDGFPALALSADPYSKDIMKKPPKKATEKIMNKSMMFNVIFVAVLITVAILGLFYWGMIKYDLLEETIFIKKIQTIVFTALIVMELIRVYTIRLEYKLGLFSNKYLLLAVFTSFTLQLAVIYTPLSTFFGTLPLSLIDWTVIMGANAMVFVLSVFGIIIKNRIKWFKE